MLDIKNRETLEIYVLGDDFKFYQNLKYLPLTSYPSNIQSALIVYSLRGTAKISVGFQYRCIAWRRKNCPVVHPIDWDITQSGYY